MPRCDGEALWDLTTESERKRFLASTRDGVLTDPPPGLDARAPAHPLASFLQPLRLSSGIERIPRKVYVYMSGWPDIPLAAMYDRVKDDPGWHAEVWTNGHDIIGQASQDTAELLLTDRSPQRVKNPERGSLRR